MRRLIETLGVLMVSSLPAYAQMGSVVGSVMDESGGVVPGASVALTAQPGSQKTTTTSPSWPVRAVAP